MIPQSSETFRASAEKGSQALSVPSAAQRTMLRANLSIGNPACRWMDSLIGFTVIDDLTSSAAEGDRAILNYSDGESVQIEELHCGLAKDPTVFLIVPDEDQSGDDSEG